jgi:two-component system chemotaxis sensor kinase CheA
MMANRNQDIKERLLAIFRTEAEEHLQTLTTNLLALEHGLPPGQAREVIEATFREAHTLKGAARSVSLMDVEAVCQAMESILSRITQGQRVLSPPILNHLQEAVDGVARLLAGSADSTAVPDLIRCLEEAANEAGIEGQGSGVREEETGGRGWGLGVREQGPSPNPQTPIPNPQPESVRLSTAKLGAHHVNADDRLVPKLAAEERVREARTLIEALKRVIGVGGQGLGAVPGSSPSPIPHPLTPALRPLQAQAEELLHHLATDQRTISRAVDDLQNELRRTRLTPASTVLDLFPRMVRDLAREHNKEVEWGVQGADLEVDRKVLEMIKEPLIHLVRNAIDHGIEPPEARVQAGKAPRGQVAVTVVSLEGGRIEIRMEDDGAGIDLARVKAAAVRTRFLTAEEAEALTDDQALELIFRSGLSTSPIITDLSGHGLGLAIVKEGVERLGGQIHVETRAGAWTTIRMILPASITTFRGLVVQTGGQPFLLPTEAVERAIRIAPEDVEHVEGRQAIRWDGHPLYLSELSALLGVSDRAVQPESGRKRPCLIVSSGEEQVGLMVEEILGEQEVLVKQFGPPLVRIKNVAAAGLLGTGQVVLILRPTDLVKSIRKIPRISAPPAAPEEERRQPVILVVDDSITTRTMEKNILEAAGYQVQVAVDGLEAWTALKGETFDLVVSDVDMPRMDGFELTARVRADRTFADLPIVLVTALESREDKERGIEVGANAYVVKSSFDQSNLLEIIRRLV